MFRCNICGVRHNSDNFNEDKFCLCCLEAYFNFINFFKKGKKNV